MEQVSSARKLSPGKSLHPSLGPGSLVHVLNFFFKYWKEINFFIIIQLPLWVIMSVSLRNMAMMLPIHSQGFLYDL